MRPVLLFLLASISAFAQPFSAGIKAGIPLTDFLNAASSGTFDYTAATQRYIIGGMAEVRLPLGLGVEFDALYRRLSYTGAGTLANGVVETTSTGGSNWEFPLLLKYRFHFPVVRPYLDAGVAWDTLAGLKQTVDVVGMLAPMTASSSPSELERNTTMGFVIGGGIDIHAVFLHISPELRFTRWNSAQISASSGGLHSNLNQAEFLVGVTF
jgi:opacity protein-like surface antigen